MFQDNHNKLKFASVIVLYDPADDIYLKSLRTLKSLEIKSFIFDNSESKDIRKKNKETIESEFNKVIVYSSEDGNIGISKAYNKVVRKLVKNNDIHGLFLFDQDSQVEEKSILKLIKTFNFLSKIEEFGSISGFPIRNSSKPYGLYKFADQKYQEKGIISVSRVPSSFSLIPIDTFKRIGLFNESYFIDNIDLDFCVRCIFNNLSIYVDIHASFVHNVGEGDIDFLGLYSIPVCSPFRHYYQIRNQILCYKENNTNLFKLIISLLRRIILMFIISFYKSDFVDRLRFSILGIFHGIKNISGKLNTVNDKKN